MKLSKIIAEKDNGSEVYSVNPDSTLQEACMLLSDYKAGSLLVSNPEGSLPEYCAIVTEHDIIRRCAEGGEVLQEPVSGIMTRDMIVATVNDNVDYILAVMKRHKIRHIPVLDGREFAGVISLGDIIRTLSIEKDITLQELKDLMGGTYRNEVF